MHINNPNELPTEKLVTILNKVKDDNIVYHSCKGVRIRDDSGSLGLGEPGLYYMDFENDYFFIRKQALFDVLIEQVTPEKIELIGGDELLKGDNPMLYALLILNINLELVEKDDYKLYFLSTERCKEVKELNDRKMHFPLM